VIFSLLKTKKLVCSSATVFPQTDKLVLLLYRQAPVAVCV